MKFAVRRKEKILTPPHSTILSLSSKDGAFRRDAAEIAEDIIFAKNDPKQVGADKCIRHKELGPQVAGSHAMMQQHQQNRDALHHLGVSARELPFTYIQSSYPL